MCDCDSVVTIVGTDGSVVERVGILCVDSAAGDTVRLLGGFGAGERGRGLSVAAEAVGVGERRTRCEDFSCPYSSTKTFTTVFLY